MNLQQLIESYQPTDEIVELVQMAKIVLLVGISGAGKDTIKKHLLAQHDYRDIISHTTRAPRQNNGTHEVDGQDYHFIDLEKATEMVANHKFVEAKFVHGTVYGTSVDEVAQAQRDHAIAITDIDVQGVREYKELSQSVVAIFVLPPNYRVWRERLRARYAAEADFQAEWSRRRASAIDELTHALSVPYYHFIINDNLDHAVHIADEIARQPDIFHRKDDEARLAARDLLEEIKAN